MSVLVARDGHVSLLVHTCPAGEDEQAEHAAQPEHGVGGAVSHQDVSHQQHPAARTRVQHRHHVSRVPCPVSRVTAAVLPAVLRCSDVHVAELPTPVCSLAASTCLAQPGFSVSPLQFSIADPAPSTLTWSANCGALFK